MRIDRRCWARAVQQAKVIWGFAGIQNPRKPYDRKAMTSAEVVLSDERFIDNLQHEEAKYIVESEDYNDDWSMHVRDKHHTHDACPHGSDEEKETFQARVERELKDQDAKYRWALDRVDWHWVNDSVSCFFQDADATFYFLKDHPVDAVWHRNSGRWISLGDVRGYCPSCDEPLDDEDRVQQVEAPHPYNEDCENDICRTAGAHCVFDEQSVLRPLYTCGNCNWLDVHDKDRPDETPFMERNSIKRPFDWPPGAPYPPRRSFSGYPMDVPPYEEP